MLKKRLLKKSLISFLFLAILLFGFSAISGNIVIASDIDDLKAQIDQRNANIAQLEKEIAQYQAEADKTSAQAKNLQSAIKQLQLAQKKLDADISVTQNKIAATNLDLQKLGIQITDKQESIRTGESALAEAL